ncbi:ATP-binding cassette domain-containing protein [Salinisphaera hydrothermalis]|uniref:ABC transporter-like protein n=1 Tax=Salinisphaera hydrothermalis (strain C41B8) TaxID=1304275 RepID=A0A084IG72_SALHC|nr:ATP-binding cassette domain-containing protein [Salinisphaera hydrothermalis]KEZ75706.1 ABC transporter-like protein [Salinisphaera hydrothermalis C41B8]
MANKDNDLVRLENVAKRFGPVQPLKNVNLRVGRGEVLGLLGNNGAGKSTLMKILCGYHPASEGKMFFDGEEVNLRSVTHARQLGIDCVYQDLALVSELNVYHNMFLQREPVRGGFLGILDNKRMKADAQRHLDDMGVNIPSVDVEIAKLSGGQRQAIAVARSVYSDARLLLLDEPTAAMGAKEGAMILDVINRLRAKGEVSVIIIAHNYAQIFDVCDRINLLRDGEIVFDKRAEDTSVQELTDIVVHEYRHAAETLNE